jgi:hypothetical protein
VQISHRRLTCRRSCDGIEKVTKALAVPAGRNVLIERFIFQNQTGGEGSLALTFLRSNSLLTGKFTGNFRFLPSKLHSILSNLHILLEKTCTSLEIGTGN